MNTKNNTNKATQQLDDLDAKAPPIDYGVITSGACSTQEAQEKFDKEQKGKPPQEFES